MAKEIKIETGQGMSEVDLLRDPIEKIVKTPGGLNAARIFAADTLKQVHLSHGAPEEDASRIAEGIRRQTNPTLTSISLNVARSLVDPNPST